MRQDELEQLSRKDLQQLAKEYGLKANKKSIELITELMVLFSQQESTQDVKKEITSHLEVQDMPDHHVVDSSVRKIESYQVSDRIQFQDGSNRNSGTIKRVNKLSVRVILEDGSELTVQNSSIFGLDLPSSQQSEEIDELIHEPISQITNISESHQEPEEMPAEVLGVIEENDMTPESSPESDNSCEESTICEEDQPLIEENGDVTLIHEPEASLIECNVMSPFAPLLQSPIEEKYENDMNICNQSDTLIHADNNEVSYILSVSNIALDVLSYDSSNERRETSKILFIEVNKSTTSSGRGDSIETSKIERCM